MSSDQQPYDIHLDDKYGSLNLIDLPAEAAAHEPWFNQTLTTVNDAVVRLGGETLFRIWRFYMAGSAYAFHCNYLNLYQVLLAKPSSSSP